MRVAVVGGTRTLGKAVVRALADAGDQPFVISRRPSADAQASISHRKADLASGEGLVEALAGVEAVIDTSNSTRHPKQVLIEGTQRLLAAEAAAGIAHHLAISIVGCDRLPISYYRVKVAQEDVLAQGAVGFSLLRATQFHTLLDRMFSGAARARLRPKGRARLQPVDEETVAKRLVSALQDGPQGRLEDIAGPEILTISELATIWSKHRRRRLMPVPLLLFGRMRRPLIEGALCAGAAQGAGRSFEEWLLTDEHDT